MTEDLDREAQTKQDPPSHLLVLALEKANSAVLQDSMGDLSTALQLYHETIEMLQTVIDVTEPEEDRARLDKIRTSYLERIEFITKKQDSESLDTPTSPTFIKHLPSTPLATKANSLFSSVFSKKSESTSTTRNSFFVKMKTSNSTPTPSLSKSSSLWKLNGKRNNSNKNNRRSTDLTDFNNKSNIDLDVPALPSLDRVHDHSEDLFDLNTKSTFASGSRKSTDTESTLSADGDVIKGTAEKLDLVINTPVMIQADMAAIKRKDSAHDPMNELAHALSQVEESNTKKPTMKIFTSSSRKSSMKKPKEPTDSPKSEKQSNSGFGTLFKTHRLLPQKSFESNKAFNNKSTVSLQTVDTDSPPPTPKPSRKNTLKLPSKARKWSMANNESSISINTITKNTNLFSGSVSKHLAKVQHQTSGSPTRVRSMCFLEEPSKESRSDEVDSLDTFDATTTYILLDRLHKSMIQGGYISTRLHVPMDIWYQKNVRLPVLDAKITACEVLISLLDKMDSRHTFDNTGNVSRDLKTLDATLTQIKYSLIRKLQYIESKGQQALITQYKTYIGILSKDNASKTSQTFASWGSKLTKSMERINITINPHDQMNLYIKTLIRLFTSVKVLVRWSERLQERYDQSKGETKPINKSILKAHNECVEQFGLIFCGFILRDYTILLDKWMKRAQEWSLD